MRALLVTLTIAGLLAGCGPYQRPGETAQDAFLRHESARRSLNDAMTNLRANQQYYMPTRGNVITCTHNGNTSTCQ